MNNETTPVPAASPAGQEKPAKSISTVCKTNEEWRKERSKSIGASAIGAIIGEDAFCTPLQLADRMKAELRGEFDYEETPAMVRGHAYESGVAYQFAHYEGKEIIKSSAKEYLVRRPDIPFMHASPDRTYWIDPYGPKAGKFATTNKGILECKTTRMPVDPDNLPLKWQFQLMAQMGICGFSEGYLAWDCLSIADGFGYRRFTFDQEVFDAAVTVCREFWERYVVGDDVPTPVTTVDVVRLYPVSDPSKTILVDEEISEQLAHIGELASTKKELERELEEAKQALILRFHDEEAIVNSDGKPLATYKTRAASRRVDSKLLKKQYPDIYEECSTLGEPTRTLLIK